jgi:hypothetical protein
VAGFLEWRADFDPESVHVKFVTDKMGLGDVRIRVIYFSFSVFFH